MKSHLKSLADLQYCRAPLLVTIYLQHLVQPSNLHMHRTNSRSNPWSVHIEVINLRRLPITIRSWTMVKMGMLQLKKVSSFSPRLSAPEGMFVLLMQFANLLTEVKDPARQWNSISIICHQYVGYREKMPKVRKGCDQKEISPCPCCKSSKL